MPFDLSGRLGASVMALLMVEGLEPEEATGQDAPGLAFATACACDADSYGFGGLGAI